MEPVFLEDFRQTLISAERQLLTLSDEESRKPRHPAAWSPKEIIGHLIDSASNNHQRFVRAQFKDDLVFPGYEQDAWVKAQAYRSEDWRFLIGLWKSFNEHLLHMVTHIPEEVLMKERTTHNLHEIATVGIPQDEPATLEYFIKDYLVHLKHHLRQIIP